jgi:uncharacterized protein YgbK (DUF1537 family)
VIGAIADDFTGATDVAIAFRRAGLRTVVVFHIDDDTELPDNDVAVVALKSRTIAAADAVEQSLHALNWLRARGATQIFFKYCSTFDSRPDGNIGPVADALSAALGTQRTVFVPASPQHLRTQYMGHLFVDRVLLSDSAMKHHPLTPMTRSYLPAVLGAQTVHDVGLIDLRDVRQGPQRITALLEGAQRIGQPYLLVDALDGDDLRLIGEACVDEELVTGSAGLAGGLGAAHAARLVRPSGDGHTDTAARGCSKAGVVLAGSCSARTLEQVDYMKSAGHPWWRLDALRNPDAEFLAKDALEWFDRQEIGLSPVVYSSLPPGDLRRIQHSLGTENASMILETAMGLIARGLAERGITRLVVAGGETSGAVVTALGVRGGVIGEEASPGVPWIHVTDQRLDLLLKSGNFGDVQLLARAAGTAA